MSRDVIPADVPLLAGVGLLAGVVSTVASVASIVSYPALIALGLPPLSANVTNTVALSFTAAGAAAGSRPELAGQGRLVARLGVVTAAGGAAGAAVLLVTPARMFEVAAPWLIAAASVMLLFQPRLQRCGPDDGLLPDERPPEAPPRERPPPGESSPGVRRRHRPWRGAPLPGPQRDRPLAGHAPPRDGPPPGESSPGRPPRRWPSRGEPERAGGQDSRGGRSPIRRRRSPLPAALAGVAAYVGYFGAAGGILMLAVLGPLLRQPLVKVNAVKNVVSGFANGVAAIAFALFGPVRWTAAAPLAVGFLAGGWLGPALARRLPARALRILIGVTGLAVAARLAVAAYG